MAYLIGKGLDFALLDYMDIGGKFAEWLDTKDAKPKNGWIDV